MKRFLTAAALGAALCSGAATAGDNLLDRIDDLAPGENSPELMQKLWADYGTQFSFNAAFGYWQTDNAAPRTNMKNTDGLFFGMLRQRVLDSPVKGNTWLRFEMGSTYGFDHGTSTREPFTSGFGTAKLVHGDILGTHDAYILEASVEQRFLHDKLCVNAGIVDFTNYFDLTRYTNSTFRHYVSSSFKFSSIIPTGMNGNLSALVQAQLSERDFVQVGAMRLVADLGDDPFMDWKNNGFAIIGEWGHDYNEHLRTNILPLFKQVDTGDFIGRTAGIAGTVDYKLDEQVGFFLRSGVMGRDDIGNSVDFSCGTQISFFPERKDDYLGIACGMVKGSSPAVHNREQKLEVMYRFCFAKYWSIVPHFEWIHDPSYRSTRDEQLWGTHVLFRF